MVDRPAGVAPDKLAAAFIFACGLIPLVASAILIYVELPMSTGRPPAQVYEELGSAWAGDFVLIPLGWLAVLAATTYATWARFVGPAADPITAVALARAAVLSFGVTAFYGYFPFLKLNMALKYELPVEGRTDEGFAVQWIVVAGLVAILIAIAISIFEHLESRKARRASR